MCLASSRARLLGLLLLSGPPVLRALPLGAVVRAGDAAWWRTHLNWRGELALDALLARSDMDEQLLLVYEAQLPPRARARAPAGALRHLLRC